MTEYTFEASLEGIEFERIELDDRTAFIKCSIEASHGKATISFQTEDTQFESKTVSRLRAYATISIRQVVLQASCPSKRT